MKSIRKPKKKHLELSLQVLDFIEVFGSSTWARTRDLRINSPALYQLSYRGIQPQIIASIFSLFEIASTPIKFMRVECIGKTRSATMSLCLQLRINPSGTVHIGAGSFAARHLKDDQVSTPSALAGCRRKLSASRYRMGSCRPCTGLAGSWRCAGCTDTGPSLFAGNFPMVQ